MAPFCPIMVFQYIDVSFCLSYRDATPLVSMSLEALQDLGQCRPDEVCVDTVGV